MTDIVNRSADFSLVFIELREPDSEEATEEYADYLKQLLQASQPLKNLILVLAGDDRKLSRLYQ